MSFAHPSWSSVESTDNPMIFTFLLSNCGFIFAMYPSSVVHTGVKSFGCENSTAHESPIQSWKRIRPSVESASKSGAVSPIFNAIGALLRPQKACIPSQRDTPQRYSPVAFSPDGRHTDP